MATDKADAGYATLTAIVLCAAVSVLCAGALSLAMTQRTAEARLLKRVQAREAINTAVMAFAGGVASAGNPFEVRGQDTVTVDGVAFPVTLTAQSEAAKWPSAKADQVTAARLAKVTRRSPDKLLASVQAGVKDDCAMSLFSDLGQADPLRDLPISQAASSGAFSGAFSVSSARDGQVWRIRAVSGGQVEERRVRFTGDPDHSFALLSIQRLPVGDMPECTDLTARS